MSKLNLSNTDSCDEDFFNALPSCSNLNKLFKDEDDGYDKTDEMRYPSCPSRVLLRRQASEPSPDGPSVTIVEPNECGRNSKRYNKKCEESVMQAHKKSESSPSTASPEWCSLYAQAHDAYKDKCALGKVGVAILKSSTEYGKLVIYKTKSNVMATLLLNPESFNIFKQDQFLQFYDDAGQCWSLNFSKAEDEALFIKLLQSLSIEVSDLKDVNNVQRESSCPCEGSCTCSSGTHSSKKLSLSSNDTDASQISTSNSNLLQQVAKECRDVIKHRNRSSSCTHAHNPKYSDECTTRRTSKKPSRGDRTLNKRAVDMSPISCPSCDEVEREEENLKNLDNCQHQQHQMQKPAIMPRPSILPRSSKSPALAANSSMSVYNPVETQFLQMLFCENRSQFSEMRMNVHKIEQKLDKIHDKMEQISDRSSSPPSSFGRDDELLEMEEKLLKAKRQNISLQKELEALRSESAANCVQSKQQQQLQSSAEKDSSIASRLSIKFCEDFEEFDIPDTTNVETLICCLIDKLKEQKSDLLKSCQTNEKLIKSQQQYAAEIEKYKQRIKKMNEQRESLERDLQLKEQSLEKACKDLTMQKAESNERDFDNNEQLEVCIKAIMNTLYGHLETKFDEIEDDCVPKQRMITLIAQTIRCDTLKALKQLRQ